MMSRLAVEETPPEPARRVRRSHPDGAGGVPAFLDATALLRGPLTHVRGNHTATNQTTKPPRPGRPVPGRWWSPRHVPSRHTNGRFCGPSSRDSTVGPAADRRIVLGHHPSGTPATSRAAMSLQPAPHPTDRAPSRSSAATARDYAAGHTTATMSSRSPCPLRRRRALKDSRGVVQYRSSTQDLQVVHRSPIRGLRWAERTRAMYLAPTASTPRSLESDAPAPVSAVERDRRSPQRRLRAGGFRPARQVILSTSSTPARARCRKAASRPPWAPAPRRVGPVVRRRHLRGPRPAIGWGLEKKMSSSGRAHGPTPPDPQTPIIAPPQRDTPTSPSPAQRQPAAGDGEPHELRSGEVTRRAPRRSRLLALESSSMLEHHHGSSSAE